MVLEDLGSRSLVGRGVVLAAAAVLMVGCSAGASSSPAVSAAPSPVVSASPAAAGSGGPSVAAALSEFKIELAAANAAAGSVSFKINNAGTTVHEFVVFKTDLAADKLPLATDGTEVDENGAGLTLVDEAEDIAIGASPNLAVDLPAGKYVLICNLPAHYTSGMRAAFTTQ
jgi:uncharacterized cupredoxin-like copper-binding protein